MTYRLTTNGESYEFKELECLHNHLRDHGIKIRYMIEEVKVIKIVSAISYRVLSEKDDKQLGVFDEMWQAENLANELRNSGEYADDHIMIEEFRRFIL